MKSATHPSLSVVMPAHNAGPFLNESIQSIVNQTFGDFELLILDDASTDGSEDVVRDWQQKDNRIKLIKSDIKLGLVGSSNLVVTKATAPIVARMDADDISHPDRLRRQLQVLNGSPDVVAVGSLCDGIDDAGRTVRPRDRWRIIRSSRYIAFPHGAAMFRRTAFDRIGGYSEKFPCGEDQDFFYRLTSVGKVVTLPDVLYHYRYHTTNATLVTGGEAVHAVRNGNYANGFNDDLPALYMLGAMRLWSGHSPAILPELLRSKALGWNAKSLIALSSASLGSISPAALRFLLRTFIRTRDSIAGLRIKDGRAYEWRFK